MFNALKTLFSASQGGSQVWKHCLRFLGIAVLSSASTGVWAAPYNCSELAYTHYNGVLGSCGVNGILMYGFQNGETWVASNTLVSASLLGEVSDLGAMTAGGSALCGGGNVPTFMDARNSVSLESEASSGSASANSYVCFAVQGSSGDIGYFYGLTNGSGTAIISTGAFASVAAVPASATSFFYMLISMLSLIGLAVWRWRGVVRD